ncbi:hypothetical protein [Flavobacterium sp.]|uniref:hypothetical protein n=1 Tax=Flavobacterium sp. TaxID=239 RepID=UPI0037BE7295
MKKLFNLITLLSLTSFFSMAQTQSQSFSRNHQSANNNVVMTWNKNTPEQEMKDDIKALKEYGVNIKYNNVKRNNKNEITAIEVAFEDQSGSKGNLSYNSPKPIPTIKFYKQGDSMGFGEPENSLDNNPFFSSISGEDMMKKFQFNFDNDSISVDKFDFQIPGRQGFSQAKSRIKILRDDRKPLVLEDGKVIEGGEDYTQEEIDEIQKNNQNDLFSKKEFPGFNFSQNDDIAEQMKKMQEQIDRLMKHNKLENEESTDKDLEDSKKELEKAKKELEEARKEIKKTKSSLKTQKT